MAKEQDARASFREGGGRAIAREAFPAPVLDDALVFYTTTISLPNPLMAV